MTSKYWKTHKYVRIVPMINQNTAKEMKLYSVRDIGEEIYPQMI
jgi:hypothetical protein